MKNTAFIYFKSAFTKVVDIFIVVVVVRSLPVADFGIYSFLLGSMPLLQVFTTGGILTLFQRYVPEYVARGAYPLAKQLIYKAFLAAIPILVLILSTIFLLAHPISEVFNIPLLRLYLGTFVVYAFLYLTEGMVSQILSSLLMQKHQTLNYCLYATLRGTLFVSLYLEDRLSILTLLRVEVASYALLLVLNFLAFLRVFWHKYRERRRDLGKDEARRVFRYALYSSVNELGATVLFVQTDYYVISYFLGPAYVGLYSLANRVRALLDDALPFRKGYEVIRSLFFSNLRETNNEKEVEAFNFLLKLSLFFVLPAALIVGILGNSLIQYVFSSKYLAAYPVMAVLLTYMIGSAFFFVLNLIVQLRERVEILLYSKMFAIYNLLASILVVKFLGILGVALASLTALVFQNVFIYYRIQKHGVLTVDIKPLALVFVNACFGGAMAYFLRPTISSIFDLAMVAFVSGGVFLTMSSLNKAFSQRERDFLNRALGLKVWIF